MWNCPVQLPAERFRDWGFAPSLTNILDRLNPGEGGNLQGMDMLAALSPQEVDSLSPSIDVKKYSILSVTDDEYF